MAQLKTLLVLFSLLGACAQPYEAELVEHAAPKTIALDIRVKAGGVDVGAVVEAADQWQEASGGLVQMTISIVENDNGTGIYLETEAPSVSLGSTTCVGCYPALMKLNPPLIAERKDSTAGILMHELGHVLGLDHAASGLMFANDGLGWAPCIDAETVAKFCSVNKCPPGAHATCPAK